MSKWWNNNCAGIGIVVAIGAVILGVREWGWYREINAVKKLPTMKGKFRVVEPIRVTGSQCIIYQRGLEYRTQNKECRKSNLDTILVGDEVAVVGSWQAEVIRGIGNQKGFINVTKVEVRKIQPKPIWNYWWWVRRFQRGHDQIVAVFQQSLPEPEASLIAGIVIGEQANFPISVKETLKRTGLMHVVAASGFNVVVVINLLTGLSVRWWGRKWGSVWAGVGLWGYVGLVGGSPPIVRAGIMGGLSLVGVISGREYWSVWALIIAVWVMLARSPWLIQSVSFQLTVAATIGLMVGTKKGEMVKRVEEGNLWREGLRRIAEVMKEAWITTMAAMIATWPLQVIYFGQISLLGLLVNPLVLWMIPPLMYTGGVQLGLGFIHQWGATMGAWVTYPLLHMWVEVIIWMGKLPFGNISVPANWWMAAGWWMVWGGLVSFINRRVDS